jgi:DNA-binding MarR family transcriptional regulator
MYQILVCGANYIGGRSFFMAAKTKVTGVSIKAEGVPFKIHPALKKNFGYCLYKAAMRFRGLLDEALQKYKIVTPQLGMLRIVHEAGSLSQQDIGHCLGIDKASMVKFLDQLENLKLVSRSYHREDRRIRLVSLTNKGTKVLNEVAVIRAQIEEDFLKPLTKSERDLIKKLIPKLTRGTLSI